ncbi:MAG: GNAT family N-acetyltransferase [Thiobacillaceae bacterium]
MAPEALPRACRIGEQAFWLAEVEAGHAPQVEALFAQAFGAPPPPGWYQWKYGRDGLQGRAVGLWDESGRLIAHYAGFPRPLLWYGRPLAGIQIGDVMVAPHLRGLLSRRGPFFQVCSAFFTHWVGKGRPYALAFGFPHARAIRLGVSLGLYEVAGQMTAIAWPAEHRRLPLGWRYEVLTGIATPPRVMNVARPVPSPLAPPPAGEGRFKSRYATFTPNGATSRLIRLAARAWQNQAAQSQKHILGVRDADYLLRRYLRRPDVHYHYLSCRRWVYGQNAVAILKHEGQSVRWLDFIGPDSALPATVAAVCCHAAQAGLDRIEAWASQKSLATFQALGAAVGDVAAHIALAARSDCRHEAILRDGWWLAGDTDFL